MLPVTSARTRNNTGVLALGTLIASIVGTAGAAMILIRPLIRANGGRKHNAHVVVFFIILAANVGGALSPVGEPPRSSGSCTGAIFLDDAASVAANPDCCRPRPRIIFRG